MGGFGVVQDDFNIGLVYRQDDGNKDLNEKQPVESISLIELLGPKTLVRNSTETMLI